MATHSQTAPSLDHIILLLPTSKDLEALPPSFTKHFTITPGGTHADNLTANALIPLQSGTYIELIAFTSHAEAHPDLKAKHWWGKKAPGWIDWCLSSAHTSHPGDPDNAKADVAAAEARLRARAPFPDVQRYYSEPVAGGRTKPDGSRIAWQVTFPERAAGFVRGALPFWCHDTTPRGLRAPSGGAAVRHPSGVVGVAGVRLAAAEEDVAAYAEAYAALAGGEGGGDGAEFDDPVNRIEVATGPEVTVGAPEDDGEKVMVAANGGQPTVVEVTFLVGEGSDVPGPEEANVGGHMMKFSFRGLKNSD